MSDVLREWLIHQLGLEIPSLQPQNLCSKFQNGVLIGKLLQNYDVISAKDFALLANQDDEESKTSNFRHLETWLNKINMPLDSDTVDGIMSGVRSVIFGFLYKLCFDLESPKKLNLIGQGKQLFKSLGDLDFPYISNTPENTVNEFTYKKQSRSREPIVDKSTCREKSEEKINKLCDKINKFQSSLPAKVDSWDSRGDQSCIRYLADLKDRKQHSVIYEAWRKKTINSYLKRNLNANTRQNQEVLRKKSAPDRLNLMSECEEKMFNKVNNSRYLLQKYKTVSVKNVTRNTKDHSLTHERRSIINEETKLNLKEKLMDVNANLRKTQWKKTLESIVQELIDLSVKGGAYSKKHGDNIPNYSWNNWTEMFVKGRPLLNTLDDSLGLLLDPKHLADNESYAAEEIETQSILNRKDIVNYLKGTGDWSEKELGVHIQRPPDISRVLGFLVYDVITSLHPLPTTINNINGEIFGPVLSVLNGKIEEISKQNLCDTLIKRNILPVLPETALLYCLNAYYQESDDHDLINALDNDNKNTTLSPKSYEYITKVPSNNAKSNTVNETEITKLTQTPENINQNFDLETIKCGQNIFMNIYKGKPLPIYYLIDSILCYIKGNKMQGGCVLVGYPNKQEELMVLEEKLAEKHYPPYGSYNYIKNQNLTLLVPFKSPNLGGKRRYKSSLTSYLKILPDENLLNSSYNEMYRYYKANDILTLLQKEDENPHFNNRDIDFICDILTGKTIDWSEETDWLNRVNALYGEESLSPGDSFQNNEHDSGLLKIHTQGSTSSFKRTRLQGKSEFDFVDHISVNNRSVFSSSSAKSIKSRPINKTQVKSTMFINQFEGNTGQLLGKLWQSLENEFIENMENCFFHRRILLCEQEPYMAALKNYLNEMLNKSNKKKIELIKRLQYSLFNKHNNIQVFPDVNRQMLPEVIDTKLILTEWTNKKIENCREFIGVKNVENWLEKHINLMFMIYKRIMQTEVDRSVNTLTFINAYMSKLFNKKLVSSVVSKKIEIPLITDQNQFRVKMVQNLISFENYLKIFDSAIKIVSDKMKSMFSKTSEWVDEIKEAQYSDFSEENSGYLKIWKYLVEMENRRSVNQLKLIIARFQRDIMELNVCIDQYKFDMIQRINDRLKHDMLGIDRICNLFETAINEGQIIRHEIIFINDHFYLNPENILFPSDPPPQPFPLLEPEDICVISIDDLGIIVNQLTTICPDKCISLVALTSYIKHQPQFKSFNQPNRILRTMFGTAVNYVDWSDLIINCVELPCPNIDVLLDIKNQYAELEVIQRTNFQQDHVEGTIDRVSFDLVKLWFQNTLPSSPSTCLRYMKTKDLLFTIFSIDGGLDYISMLLALCKDENTAIGLIKAVSLVMGRNIMLEQHDDLHDVNEFNSIKLPMEILYKTLFISLKNYMAPEKNDMDALLSTLLNTYNDMRKCYGNNLSIARLLKNDKFKIISETGFRFNLRHLSNIVKNLREIQTDFV